MRHYSQQAKDLQTFFNGATITGNAELASKFSAIAAAEGNIRTKNNMTPEGFLNYTDQQKNAIYTQIFGASGAARTTFEQYANAYGKGHNVQRDWRTMGEGTYGETWHNTHIEAAVVEFVNAVTALNDGDVEIPNRAINGSEYGPIGYPSNISYVHSGLKAKMKGQIITALGLTGKPNADQMAEALVIQLVDDVEEFRAFINDLKGEAANYAPDMTTEVLNHTFNLNTYHQIAEVQETQTQRLASVNAEFAPDMLKSAYGKPFEQYTGNFTPYKKNDMTV
jgi:hypothetical protein